jgi:uncharacterized membrane protein
MSALGSLLGMVVFLAFLLAIAIPVLIIWALVSVFREIAGGPPRPRYDPAVEALRYRLARGEITEAQFEQAMWDLGYEKVR